MGKFLYFHNCMGNKVLLITERASDLILIGGKCWNILVKQYLNYQFDVVAC